MKRGFTLVELLAVILILAFIALIAVPLVLDIIEDTKVESIRLSVESYLDGVEKSILSNMTVDGKNYDGIYTVKDNGKLLSSYDSEIYIDYTGNGLEEGIIQIKDGKAVRLSRVKIKGYYAKLENEKVNLYKNINESTLVSGKTFNQRIKQFIDASATSNTEDTTIISIAFLPDGMLPRGYTKESLEKLNSIDLSSKNDESIIGYYDNNGNIYVYSDNYMLMGSISDVMFLSFKSLKKIDFNGIDTSEVTSMNNMFRVSESVEKLDLSYFNTEKVIDMGWMFAGCKNLTELELGNFNTSNVKNMSLMFSECNSLKELNLSSFNTSSVTNMWNMFANCSSLTELDLSGFDTSNVASMTGGWNGGLFGHCLNLKTINLGNNFVTDKITDLSWMFNECKSLYEIDLSGFDTSNVTTFERMFYECNSLRKADLSNFNTGFLNNMFHMFEGCNSIESIMFGENFNTSQVESFQWIFHNCYKLTTLDLSSWDTSQATDSGVNMFNSCRELEEVIVSDKWTLDKNLLSGTKATEYTLKN